jgi:hypothetical protein
MELAVRPDEVQRALHYALSRTLSPREASCVRRTAPTYKPITPMVRIDAMEKRLDAMLRAINIVQPALQKFYGS